MKSWKTWIGVVLSIAFLSMALGNIDWALFKSSMATISLPLFVFVMLIVVFTLAIRGVRWHYLLKPVTPVSPVTLFWSTTIGFAVNNVLPARLGEVARAYSAHRRGGAPFGAAFGTIVVERLYDTFSALFLFVAAILVFDFGDMESVFGVGPEKVAVTLGAGGAVLLAGIVVLKWKTDFAMSILRVVARPLPDAWTAKIERGFRSFVGGFTQSTKPFDVAVILAISVIIWIISAIQIRWSVATFGLYLNREATVILVMAIVVAVAVPAAPGYVGVYHYLAQQALIRYAGVEPSMALSMAVVVHASNYIPQTAVGLARFAYEGLRISDLRSVRGGGASEDA